MKGKRENSENKKLKILKEKAQMVTLIIKGYFWIEEYVECIISSKGMSADFTHINKCHKLLPIDLCVLNSE